MLTPASAQIQTVRFAAGQSRNCSLSEPTKFPLHGSTSCPTHMLDWVPTVRQAKGLTFSVNMNCAVLLQRCTPCHRKPFEQQTSKTLNITAYRYEGHIVVSTVILLNACGMTSYKLHPSDSLSLLLSWRQWIFLNRVVTLLSCSRSSDEPVAINAHMA